MKNISVLAVYFLSIMLQSCDRGNAEGLSDNPAPATITVVLCDLTKSIDGSSIDSIARHAVQLKSLANDGAQLYYFGIGPSDYNVHLGEYSFTEPARETDEDRARRLAVWHSSDDSLLQKIKRLYNYERYQSTCITYSLNTAYELLKEQKAFTANATLNLVVLSDMIEDCEHHSLGRLRLTTKEKLALTKKVIAADSATNINLKQLGVHLYMVSESEMAETNLSRSELQDTWSLILTKFGYAEKDPLVNFEWQRLPNVLLNQN